jgi:aspartyl-tRNA(Asn)/glutamyl-tRNA(Gln) amidotransferase subunit B
MSYKPTIGLEIHAELKTSSKMFCGCKNDPFNSDSNANICPVCTGQPGTLPVANIEAIKNVLKVGVAIGGNLADFSEFDRKNYFYPDIPKGYQISQYKYPLVSGGEINGIEITRIHIEEDTGTSLHEEGDYSLVDFNRAGVPLMELVTEPVIHSAKDAGDFARELQLILRTLDVSYANMERGEMRVEANISISKDEKFGTKVEVKNLNSFKAVEKAIEYEIKRQENILEAGERVVQETRGWDENTQKTFSQRKKEESHDYRYFPEPDLPKLKLENLGWAKFDNIKKDLPELPKEKRLRYKNTFGIKDSDIEFYLNDQVFLKIFEEGVKDLKSKDEFILLSNYISSDLAGLVKNGADLDKISGRKMASIILLIKSGKLSSRGAKDVLIEVVKNGGEPNEIASVLGVVQVSDEGAIKAIVERVIKVNDKVVNDYKTGKVAALQYLVGQVMKESKGSAKPDIVKEIILSFIS